MQVENSVCKSDCSGSTQRVSIRWGGYRMDTWEKEGAERRRKSGPLQEVQLGMELDWGKYGGCEKTENEVKDKTRSTNTNCQFNQDLAIVTNGGGQVWKTSGGEHSPANGERKRWASTPSRTSLLAFFYIFDKAIVQIQIAHPHMRNCSERVWKKWSWVQDESKGKESNKDIKKLSWDTSSKRRKTVSVHGRQQGAESSQTCVCQLAVNPQHPPKAALCKVKNTLIHIRGLLLCRNATETKCLKKYLGVDPSLP